MQNINVLVFPCGSEVGLEICKSLKNISFVTLFGGSSVNDHGMWEYERYIDSIPYINDDNFLLKLNEIIKTYHINYIFPALDSVVLKLSELRDNICAEILTSSKEAVEICRSKEKTYQKLQGEYFLPATYSHIKEVTEYPVLIKPAIGQGAQGVKIVNNEEELEYELNHRKEQQVVCEYLPGVEFTVDCFTDRKRVLKYCAYRSRRRIKNGISVNSVLEPHNEEINKIAEIINSKMEFRGAWFFQVKLSKNNEYKLMEVATRVAGTMCVERAVGVNLPLLTIFDALEYDVQITPQFEYVETDRALENCYKVPLDFDELYIDYDDTIIVHDKINLQAIALIYKCINKNIPVYLITKHIGNVHNALMNRKISELVFTKIIHIKANENKCDFISPSPKALFVDDSFSERDRIQKHFNIKTIGVDALEVLLNGVMM